MKRVILILSSILFMGFAFNSCSLQDKASIQLAKRILPKHYKNFIFEKISDSLDFYEISEEKGKIKIKGNNSNSIAVGLNHYLKYYCNTTISWDSRVAIEIPDILPLPDSLVRVNAMNKERFFLNYCTFGYTMPWWQWEEWEHFIDWMALNGVTMPLAITGQEAIWQKVWLKYGLTDEQIRNYFTGPAHLPWHRMSNIDYWQGPLPQSWIDSQAKLQKKILKRERELGMKPILPAFAGHIPRELAEVKQIDTSRVSYWGGFANEYRCTFLAPTDPLYTEIQKDYLEIQTQMYGTDHIYGIDPFNEIDAPSWDPKTLAEISSNIYKSLSDVDSEAIWLQMGWLFYADPTHWTQENISAFLQAVPRGKMILLDYYCDFIEIWKQTSSFYGQDYIWCYLGNFGGNTMLSGNFDTVSSRISDAQQNGGENMLGIGSTLEGFGVNMFMYEYVLERAWNTQVDDNEWIKHLADRRFGSQNEEIRKAWASLCHEIYTAHSTTGHATLTCAHPCFEGNWYWTTKPSKNYSPEKLLEIWKIFLVNKSDTEAYKFDIVNIGRQVLGDYFYIYRDSFTKAYQEGDIDKASSIAAKMLETFDLMDELLACNIEFSLEDWISKARAMGSTEEEKDYYETNARTLISVWGDSNHLTDYASRAWSGMMSSYYKKRWEMFLEEAINCMRTKTEFDHESFDKKIWEFENAWAKHSHKIKFPESKDPYLVSMKIFTKLN